MTCAHDGTGRDESLRAPEEHASSNCLRKPAGVLCSHGLCRRGLCCPQILLSRSLLSRRFLSLMIDIATITMTIMMRTRNLNIILQ